ncbi:hypothetical protein [Streptomyces sp. NPDC001508]|uniref:hypothetical protein n=1 Tax=Streptomyces sp. NPDC001508 TaxID=3154656 RepID=UPI00331A708C
MNTVTECRETFRRALGDRGLFTPGSRANFVWLPVGDQAEALEAACVRRGVSVRAFAGEGVRVTVGCPEAEAAVLAAVDESNGRAASAAQ